jgi:hypothetical protein
MTAREISKDRRYEGWDPKSAMGSSGVWSGYEGKENGNGCRGLTN